MAEKGRDPAIPLVALGLPKPEIETWELAESIAIVLNTIEANMRTEDLLKQSQSLAQQLQTRQEELQKTNGDHCKVHLAGTCASPRWE